MRGRKWRGQPKRLALPIDHIPIIITPAVRGNDKESMFTVNSLLTCPKRAPLTANRFAECGMLPGGTRPLTPAIQP
jgi:hypothetical protein